MRKNLVFILVLVSIRLFSQNFSNEKCLVIEYDMGLNFNKFTSYNSILQITSKMVTFKYFQNIDEKKNENDIPNDDEIKIEIVDNKPIYIFTNPLTNSIIEVSEKANMKYLKISDNPNKIIWKIMDEYKIIDQFQCQKAVGNFRGRDYTVWFTTELPVFFGPLKLHGLPGAIIEVRDSKNEVVLFAKKITYQCYSDLLDLERIEGEIIDRKNFIKESNLKIKNILNNISTKAPRGYKIEVKNLKLNSIEIEN